MIFRFNRFNEVPSPVVYPPSAPVLESRMPAEPVHTKEPLDVVYIEAERFHDAREVAHVLLGTRSVHGVALELPLLELHRGEFYEVVWTGYAANNTLERKVNHLTRKEVKARFKSK